MKQPKRLDYKRDYNGLALFEKAQRKYITFLKRENKQLRLNVVSTRLPCDDELESDGQAKTHHLSIIEGRQFVNGMMYYRDNYHFNN